ncbi:2Fe-2S iron-sulfur cluster binding domain-containing protein, partial [Planctomycetota bacterium]|nr:2Fe-2S iron-sulfur cluster binding domain-containing protein [Planctomycetota bacterium]
VAVDLKTMFGVSDEKVQDAMDILRPFENLVPVIVEGNEIQLPENNSLWRGMQFWGLMTGEILIDFGLFCIAGTCKNCKSRVIRDEETGRESVLACQTKVQPGLIIKKLPNGFTYRKKQTWG